MAKCVGGDAGEEERGDEAAATFALGVGGLPDGEARCGRGEKLASTDDSREWAALEEADGGLKKDAGSLRCAYGSEGGVGLPPCIETDSERIKCWFRLSSGFADRCNCWWAAIVRAGCTIIPQKIPSQ